jgi:glycosyltransferase involved in cell wall biosynthesis
VFQMTDTICLLPRKLGLGGPASFQARLADALRQQGINVVFDPDDLAVSAILVVGGTRQFGDLRQARRRGVRIVQRLNGMNWVHKQKYTGPRHFLRAEYGNFILSTIRRSLADRIIYQSQFTQGWWQRVYGLVKAPSTVIYNGVDLSEYSPFGPDFRPNDRYRMLLVEGHLGGGYEQGLFTAVKAAELLNQRVDRPVELMVVGEASAALQRQTRSDQIDILWRGVVKRNEIPEIDRSAHFLFSADVNAACPNSVIEALACGLPVVGHDTGALPELLANGAGSIAAYGGDPWRLDAPNLFSLVDAAQTVLKDLGGFRAAARKQAELTFDIHAIANAYRQVLLENQS